MKYIHRYHDYESFVNDYEDDEKYIEPWVSFCDVPGDIEELTVDCHGDGQYLYGARFNSQDGDLYMWDSFPLEGGEAPGYSQYWTRSRNPQPGDPIFCSINGAQEDSRCATAGAPIKQYPEVVYNKPRFLHVRLLDGENRATLYDNYTQEEKDFFNNFYDMAGIVEPGAPQDFIFSQPIKFYFVDSIDPDFDPMTTSYPFIEATNGSYYHQGSGGEHFNVPYDGNCLFLDVYNYGDGFQTIFSNPESNILGTRIFNNCA